MNKKKFIASALVLVAYLLAVVFSVFVAKSHVILIASFFGAYGFAKIVEALFKGGEYEPSL